MFLRITVMVVGLLCFIIGALDVNEFKGFKIKNTFLKFIIYLLAVICGFLFWILDVVDVFL